MTNALIEKVRSMAGQLDIEVWADDLRHAIEGHPEVTIDRVKETLKDPSKVIQSKSSAGACLFYSVEVKIGDRESVYFCVVVAVIGAGQGKMITAYEADFMKTGKELFSKK